MVWETHILYRFRKIKIFKVSKVRFAPESCKKHNYLEQTHNKVIDLLQKILFNDIIWSKCDKYLILTS